MADHLFNGLKSHPWVLWTGAATIGLFVAYTAFRKHFLTNDGSYTIDYANEFTTWLPFDESELFSDSISSQSVVAETTPSPSTIDSLPIPSHTDSTRSILIDQQSSKSIELRIFTGTWNLGDRPPPYDTLHQWFTHSLGNDSPSSNLDLPYDIIAVGSQECSYKPRSGILNCEIDWTLAVLSAAGPEYQIINVTSLRDSIRLIVLLRKKWLSSVHSIQSRTFSTTIPMFWRKGGIGVQLSFLNTTLCFINSHLAAHEKNVAARNNDIFMILKTLKLGNPNYDPSHQFHHCFFLGDLNYRIESKNTIANQQKEENAENDKKLKKQNSTSEINNQDGSNVSHDDISSTSSRLAASSPAISRETNSNISSELFESSAVSPQDKSSNTMNRVFEGSEKSITWLKSVEMIQKCEFSSLLEFDQLLREKSKGNILTYFDEPEIKFCPTFKVQRGTKDFYDKKRTPSWCDRILTHSLPECQLITESYHSVDTILTSDHIPVYATHRISVPVVKLTYRDENFVKSFLCPFSPASSSNSTPSVYNQKPIDEASLLSNGDSCKAAEQQSNSIEKCENDANHNQDSNQTNTTKNDLITKMKTTVLPPIVLSGDQPQSPSPIDHSYLRFVGPLEIPIRSPIASPALAISTEILDTDAQVFGIELKNLHFVMESNHSIVDPNFSINDNFNPRIILSSPVLQKEPIKSLPLSQIQDKSLEYQQNSVSFDIDFETEALTKPLPPTALAYHHIFIAVYNHIDATRTEHLLCHAVVSLKNHLEKPSLFEAPLVYCGLHRGTLKGLMYVK